MFIHLMSATAAAQGTQESYLWDGLLDQWWDKVCLGARHMIIVLNLVA